MVQDVEDFHMIYPEFYEHSSSNLDRTCEESFSGNQNTEEDEPKIVPVVSDVEDDYETMHHPTLNTPEQTLNEPSPVRKPL